MLDAVRHVFTHSSKLANLFQRLTLLKVRKVG